MAKNCIPELMAPAGSLNALKAAVNAGADAVYISGKKFGARKFADNFTKSEMLDGLKFAKLRNVKVYVTVNTLMKDSQLKSAVEYIFWLYKNGVDAVIIQDLGLASLCHELIPEMNIHASTQMTIHNSDGVRWAAKFGFKRIVLSRELKISEVKKIKRVAADADVEIEIFGHGALCYSYSGQCLLSSFIGGRSGNRGVCAQPCRKAYKIITGKQDEFGRPLKTRSLNIIEKYLLSTRDLCVYDQLERIINLQVNSLKIEGRMRSAEYVAVVVKIYRAALDSLKTGKGNQTSKAISKLKLAFNRGFSGGYLLSSGNNLVMGRDAPGNRGLYMGYVKSYDRKSKLATVKLKNSYKIEKGDGVLFIGSSLQGSYNQSLENKFRNDPERQLNPDNWGMAIEKSPKYKGDSLILYVQKPLNKGSKMYLTRSLSLNHEAAAIVKNIQKPSVPIEIKIELESDMKFNIEGKFTGFDGSKHFLNMKSQFKMEKAINKPLNNDKILNQLKKTGETPFKIIKIDINYPGNLFTPISNLNSLRREFLKLGESELINTYKPSEEDVLKVQDRFKKFEKRLAYQECSYKSKSNKSLVLGGYLDSIESLKGALEGGVKRVYYEPEIKINGPSRCDSQNKELSSDEKRQISSQLNNALKLCQEFNAKLIWKWPQITHDNLIKDYKDILGSCNCLEEIMVDGLGAGESLKSVPEIKISCSAGFNVWNRETVTNISNAYDTITPSSELSRDDLKILVTTSRLRGAENPFEIIVQGNVDTLISRDCLLKIVKKLHINIEDEFWGIEDEKKHIFPIKIDINGNTHVLNSVEICLLDHITELIEMGVNGLILDMRNKGYGYSKGISSIYNGYLDQIEMGKNTKISVNKLKTKIKTISTGGITTGNYLKGVKDVQL